MTQMIQLTRYFRQVKPIASGENFQPMGEIKDFFDIHTFVVLGEPGLGKTTSFRYASEQEKDAEFVRIGEFLSSPKLDHLQDKVLYLDGLDEHRSRANGINVMDAIIGRLKQLNCPKVRISCRTAEWHGDKDLSVLSVVSKDTPVVQLILLPLAPEDIHKLVPDSENFVIGAREHGLDEFLDNPQDFLLLYEFFCETNSWPDNRSELMEGACRALLKELNKDHYEAVDDWVSDKDLARASDYLACILILSNIAGISFDRTTASKVFPSIHEFDGDLFAMKVAVGRHVFKPAENKRIEPKHRKIAEYMAARYLATRIREGLPLSRVMALMTGIDGGTPSDLRGVYAWLVTFLSGMADHVLVHDPYGAIIYGDARAWTPNTKVSALNALREWAKRDPWFRDQDRSRSALGGLSDPVLVKDFQQLLLEDNCETHILSTILDVIAGGSNLPEMGDPLLDFIRNPSKPDHLKGTAIDAFAEACPKRTMDLVTLLDEVHSGEISDPNQYLRGELLRILYPTVIGPDQVIRYFIKPSGGIIGWYHMFVNHTIFEKTDKDGLRALAQAFQNHDEIGGEDDDDFDEFKSSLVESLFDSYGDEATIEEFAEWLTIGVNKYKSSRVSRDAARVIGDFFATHESVYADIFFYYLNNRWPEDKSCYHGWWQFREFVANVSPPYGFPRLLLLNMEQEDDVRKKQILFELVCILVMNEDPKHSTVPIEDLWEISESAASFRGIYERSTKCEIEEWRQEDVIRRKEQLAKSETRRISNREELTPIKSDLEGGEAVGVLEHYSRVWFDCFYDLDHDATPRERLRSELGDALAESVELGFVSALEKPIYNTLEDIAKTDAHGKSYYRGYLILAALDILSGQGEKAILDLHDDILRLAIAYAKANHLEKSSEWITWVLKNKPDFFSQVLDSYWRVQLAANSERIKDFHEFDKDYPQLCAVKKILPGLLKDFPKAPPNILKAMLLNAIRFCQHDEIQHIVINALKLRFNATLGQRTMWISTGFVVNPHLYLKRLKEQLRKNVQEKWMAQPILMANVKLRGDEARHPASINYRKLVIETLGSVFNNVHFETKGGARWISNQDEPTVANEIRNIIHAFAEDPSDDAAKALKDLKENPSLSNWHSDILYSIANQVRTAQEARFTYPEVFQVVSSLSNAEPANVADLKALVVDALKEVSDEIRHGNTDGYKSFWNVGRYSKATSEHIDENTARDRLLELLRPKLKHLDITAEPEVRYADDKRADIAIYSRGMKLPIEIKRDDHKNIWTAAENQLEKQYSRDPASEGNGIYLVFWFDGKGMKKPSRLEKPTSANELKLALEKTVPKSSSGLIDVIVIDVSVPVEKMASPGK
jgi:hypothetical protein